MIDEYLDCLKYERNYSNNTIASYRREIVHFKVYLRIISYNEINERIKEEMRTYGNRDF